MGAYAGLEEKLVVVHGVGSIVAGTGAVTGPGIDTAGYSEALVILNIGDASATGSLVVKMQDAAADSGYADLTGAAFSAKVNQDHKIFTARLKLDGNTIKRWIKFVGTTSTDTVDYTVCVVLSGSQYNPETVTVAEWIK